MNSSKLSYRAEIDGLRAIAVVSVILYHAKMELFGRDWFEGGFIGVDIFFVISGYLITRIILFELQTKGSLSFLNFYERRARRILPMLFVVIFVSIPFAWEKLLPTDLIEYAESILASLFFGSNFFFYFSTTEYGADSALLKPFLHTWSLGVEEQFYLVFPIISIILFKFLRRYFLTILFTLSLLSLLFADFMEVRNSELNFFLPFSRFWELAVGSILAYMELNNKISVDGILKRVFPVLGLCLVFYSILFFNSKTPHPSFFSLIPIVGVVLIIGFASKDDLVGKFLGSRLFVGMGMISYSAYLWHFPIFAFSRMGEVSTNYDKFEWIFLTFFLSIVSFFLVERPFRNRKLIQKMVFFFMVILATVMTCSFMFFLIKNEGLWDRYTKVQQELIKGFNNREYLSLEHPLSIKGLHLRSKKYITNCRMRSPIDTCRFGDEKLVFLGDSYVGHYERAFIDVVNNGFISFNYDQCPFVTEMIWFGNVAECSYVNKQRKKIIHGFVESKIFVISANYSQFSLPKLRVKKPISDGRANRTVGETVPSSAAWYSFFANVNWLINRGHKVIIIRSMPSPKIEGSKWLGDNIGFTRKMNFPTILNNSVPSKIRAVDDRIFPTFDENSVLVVDPIESLCDLAKDVCMDVKENYGPLYNGGRHLSYLGANLIAVSVKQKLIEKGWISE